MYLHIGKLVLLFAILSLIACCARSPSVSEYSTFDTPITADDAVKISRNSEFVKEGIVTRGYSHATTEYYNASSVERLKKGHNPELYSHVPEGHDIWIIFWEFTVAEYVDPGYSVIVIVDAETGVITYDNLTGIAW
jgi:hypothetical protein